MPSSFRVDGAHKEPVDGRRNSFDLLIFMLPVNPVSALAAIPLITTTSKGYLVIFMGSEYAFQAKK
jgi:hypothetical protein